MCWEFRSVFWIFFDSLESAQFVIFNLLVLRVFLFHKIRKVSTKKTTASRCGFMTDPNWSTYNWTSDRILQHPPPNTKFSSVSRATVHLSVSGDQLPSESSPWWRHPYITRLLPGGVTQTSPLSFHWLTPHYFRFFSLVVSLEAETTNGQKHCLAACISERIIVRASSPSNFDLEQQLWERVDNSSIRYMVSSLLSFILVRSPDKSVQPCSTGQNDKFIFYAFQTA